MEFCFILHEEGETRSSVGVKSKLEIRSSKEQQKGKGLGSERCLVLAVGGRRVEEEARFASSLLFSARVRRRLILS